MGLDATVYCDCFERGRLRSPPPPGAKIGVGDDGSLNCAEASGRLEDDVVFDRWLFESACAHPNGVLLHHRLGNIGLVALLRQELSAEEERFPILLRQVLYDGTHGGDSIPVAQFSSLREEVIRLSSFKCSDRRSAQLMDDFARQMRELVDTAAVVQKPISF